MIMSCLGTLQGLAISKLRIAEFIEAIKLIPFSYITQSVSFDPADPLLNL